ncbi:hypothetical protein IMSAGC020_01461 [Lachnospiraceae bacterium]|nr:hypothetical protein IMSAGC020_01461 [Lachnospiraceae bacterium]
MLDDLLKPHGFRPAACNRKHIHPKGILKPCLLIEHIRQILDIRSTLQLDDDTDPLLGGLVRDIHDIAGLLRFHQSADVVQELADPRSDHRVGNLRDDQTALAALHLLDFHLAPDLNLSRPFFIDIQKVVLIHHDPACWEIRALDVLHQLFRTDLVILHVRLHCVDHFAQVMSRDTGRHTYRYPFRPVDKQVWKAHWQNLRLLLRLVKVRHKIHDVLIKVCQVCLLRHLRKTRLRVTHGRGAVALDGSEIPVAVHQDHPLFELLSHYNKGFVDGAVAVGMVFTHGISHDTGAFTVGPVIPYPQLMHIVECTPLHRLKPVPDIRQGAGYDHAHGIIYI